MKTDQQMKKRMWKPKEDMILKTYVEMHGEGNWSAVSKKLGLRRGGKSCRLRWKNYLRPDIKHGSMSKDEEDLIIRMHKLIGNRWALIAGRLPGRTDNEVKNYWNTYLSKKAGKHQARRKPPTAQISDDRLDQGRKNDKKRAEIDNEDRVDIVINQEGVKETVTNTNMHVGVVKEDKVTTSKQHRDESKVLDEEEYWSTSITGELAVGPRSLSNMDFMMDGGNRFMIFGGELDGQEQWDRGRCDLFDTFGLNWEDPLLPIHRHDDLYYS